MEITAFNSAQYILLFDPFTLGLILVTTVVGGIINSMNNDNAQRSQAEMNRRNIEAQEKMNALNRQQALDDYETVNKYNHPKQQMQRLREANLNPNLVYGNGSATQPASSVARHENKVPEQHLVPNQLPDIASMATSNMGQFANVNATNVNTQNQQIKGGLMRQQQELNQLDLISKAIGNDASKFDLQQKRDLKDTIIEQQKLRNQYIKEETAVKHMALTLEPAKLGLQKQELALKRAKNSREIASINADIIRKNWENTVKNPVQLAMLNQQLSNMEKTGKLLELETALRQKGIQPNDPLWTRIMVRISDALRPGMQQMDNSFENFIK